MILYLMNVYHMFQFFPALAPWLDSDEFSSCEGWGTACKLLCLQPISMGVLKFAQANVNFWNHSVKSFWLYFEYQVFGLYVMFGESFVSAQEIFIQINSRPVGAGRAWEA